MSSDMNTSRIDALLDEARAELYTAVVGDIMDQMGYRHQFLSPRVRPLQENMMVVGRAMTVLEADCLETDQRRTGPANPVLAQPFGLMLQALDDLKPGEIYFCTGVSPKYALWGELMTTRAKKLGAVGAVVDGYSRDTQGILTMDFPVFTYGSYAQDQAPRGKVIDFRCPVETHGVLVNDGDVIIGDIDGVCVVPTTILGEVLEKSLAKARGEKLVKKAIENGQSAQSAFDEYGVM